MKKLIIGLILGLGLLFNASAQSTLGGYDFTLTVTDSLGSSSAFTLKALSVPLLVWQEGINGASVIGFEWRKAGSSDGWKRVGDLGADTTAYTIALDNSDGTEFSIPLDPKIMAAVQGGFVGDTDKIEFRCYVSSGGAIPNASMTFIFRAREL